MKYRSLMNLVFFNVMVLFFAHLYPSYPEMQNAKEILLFSIKPYPEEGFAAGTLVRVPDGFMPIEVLAEQDVVCGEHLEPKRVLKTARRVVQRSICLTIEEDIFYVGCDQKIRAPYDLLWHAADALPEHAYLLDVFGNFKSIDTYELIHGPAILYQLEVEDHTFCVGSSCIVVHNADIATVGTAMLCLEYVAYAHPVLAVIGSTIALSTIARKAYEAYRQSHQHNYTDDGSDETPAEIFLAERYYYEQRKHELTTLRDKFAGLYSGITAIRELFHPQIATFSSQLLPITLTYHTAHSLLAISLTDELKLSDERKIALRKAREQEFELLEKEIAEIHAMLVVHFNAVIASVFEASEVYEKSLPTINQAINVWNVHKDGNLTDHIASQMYEQDIIEECLVRDIQQKIAELKVVVTFYQNNRHYACLQQSTDIINWLDALTAMIADNERWTAKELIRISNNLSIAEHYFAQRAIPTTGFKNQIKSAFHKDRSQKNAQALKKAKDTQADICASGGPNDPKEDDDDKDDDKVKVADMPENEGILGHIFRKEDGHLPKTPENYKLIQDLVKDPNNYLGPDMRGNHWWGKILQDGKQLWAQAYKGVVRNGGINDVPRPYNPKTGLSKLI